MFALVMFLSLTALAVGGLVAANGDSVKEARALARFLGLLSVIAVITAIAAIVGGAPAHIVITTAVVAVVTTWFAALAAEAASAEEYRVSEVLDLADSASPGTRRAIAAGSVTADELHRRCAEVELAGASSITTTLGTFRFRGAEFLVGYEGRPALVTAEDGCEEEFFSSSQLRVARHW